MKTTFIYHKLQVWHLAKNLVKEIYSVVKGFPAEEKFGLVSQINRAAISVASNIAEGSGRISRKDQAYFSQLAYGSLMEVACQIEISYELGFITEDKFASLTKDIGMLSEKLSALRSAQLKADQK